MVFGECVRFPLCMTYCDINDKMNQILVQSAGDDPKQMSNPLMVLGETSMLLKHVDQIDQDNPKKY